MTPLPRPRPGDPDDSNFDLTPELEAMFNALARAGREDPVARNELYARLSGKIARFLAPWQARQTALGDHADLRQEAFVLFANLVTGWSGEGSFARYFFAFFPWRLRHAIAYHERRWGSRRLLIVPQEQIERLWHDGEGLDDDATLVPGTLTEKERQLLALRLAGYSLATAARRLGWGERTAARRWRALRRKLALERGERREARGERRDPASRPFLPTHCGGCPAAAASAKERGCLALSGWWIGWGGAVVAGGWGLAGGV